VIGPERFEVGVLTLVAAVAGPVVLYAVVKSQARRSGSKKGGRNPEPR